MSFILNGTEKFPLGSIERQFDCFVDSETLPDFKISFYEKNDEHFEKENFIKKIGDHRFYRFRDGLIIANDNCYVTVYNNFSCSDVYVPKYCHFPRQQISFLILQAYRFALANAEQFQMHSAVVMHDGFGVAFCGIPGAGKSTQAHLWEEHLSAEALNLDQPIVLFDNDSVFVSGSPWSGKEECYKDIQVPLKAIFFVEQAKDNSVQKLSIAESFSYLFLNNFLLPINDDIDKKHKDSILRVVSNVPVYRLNCTISKEAVDVAYNAIF